MSNTGKNDKDEDEKTISEKQPVYYGANSWRQKWLLSRPPKLTKRERNRNWRENPPRTLATD